MTVGCTDPASISKAASSKAAAPKRRIEVKNASIALSGDLSLIAFSKRVLAAHELDELYTIGPVTAPPFKMHWSGLKWV